MDRRLPALLLILALPAHAAPSPLALGCLSCHGEAAQSAAMPPLQTMPPAAIASALREYRDGRRSGSAMPRLAQPLSNAQIDAVADALGQPP